MTNSSDRARLTAASIAATHLLSPLHRSTASLVFEPYVTGRIEAGLRQQAAGADIGILTLTANALTIAEDLGLKHLASRCQFVVTGNGTQYRIEPSADVMVALESFHGSVADLVIEGEHPIERPQLVAMVQRFGFEVYESYPDLVVVPSVAACPSRALPFPEYLAGLLQGRAEQELGLDPAGASLVAMAGVQRFVIDALCGNRNAQGFPVEYVLAAAAAIDLERAAHDTDYTLEGPGLIRVRHRGMPTATAEQLAQVEMDLLRDAEDVIEGVRGAGCTEITGAQLLGLRAWQE